MSLRTPIRLVLFGAAVLCFGLPRDGALAVPYVFKNIADNTFPAPSGQLTNFDVPAISGGVVAFWADYNSGHGVFTGNGGALTSIAKTGDSASIGTLGQINRPAISGVTTVFYASSGGGPNNGIFSHSGGPLETVIQGDDPAPTGVFSGFDGLSSVSGTTTAFHGYFNGSNAIFTSTGGMLTPIVKSGDPAPIGTFDTGLLVPVISGDKVAFSALYGGGSGAGVFIGSGGPLTTVAKSGDPAPTGTFNGFFETGINGNTAVFVGAYGSNQGVFTGSGGALTTIVKTGDPAPSGQFTGFGAPSIGGQGAVAVRGFYPGGVGLFTRQNGLLTPVIKTGDSLFDSSVTFVDFWRFGLDPVGGENLAFQYHLANGRTGIAIAALIPEPTGLLLAIIAWMLTGQRLLVSRRSDGHSFRRMN